MRPYILEEANWKQVKNVKYEVAMLPWGATEPHNYHLPYGTDSLETARIAADAAQKAWENGSKVMVLPTIPLGIQNMGQIELPFCLHTRLSTQQMILEDTLSALYNQGIRKFVLLNGHGGNDFKQLVRDLQPEFPDMFISIVNWFKLVPDSLYFEEGGDHANEMETSVILHYFPGLVGPLDETGEGNAKSFKLKSLQENVAWTPRHWGKVSEDTGVGNPKKATAEKGKKYLDDVTTKIAGFLTELADCDLDDLYGE